MYITRWLQEGLAALERGRRFVTHDVWRIGRPGEEVPTGFVIKQVRVAILLVRNLVEDALMVRAGALTFATILSIVPFMALMFFLIQNLNLGGGIYELLNRKLDERLSQAIEVVFGGDTSKTEGGAISTETTPESAVVSPNEELKDKIIGLMFQGVAQKQALDNGKELENPVGMLVNYATQGASSSGALGVAGVIFVLATVFGLMQNVERSFNYIWGVKRSRSWFRMLSDYFLITLLLPFLASCVLGVTAAMQSRRVIENLGVFAMLVQSLQYVVIWLGFSSMYFFIPNTKVRASYALIGGIIAGGLWSGMSWTYVHSQISLANYSLLYSGFAQFPLLLIWVYFSWLILLFGAELTYAYQHEKTFAMERLADSASPAYKEAVGVRAMVEAARRFDEGMPGLSPFEAGEAWNVPTRLVLESLETLEKANLVLRSAGETVRFQPARSIERIRLGDVVTALREAGEDPSALREDELYRPVFAVLSGAESETMTVSLSEFVSQLRQREANR